jgi:hypothetical protein
MGIGERIGMDNIFLSVRAAVEAVLNRDAQPPAAGPNP